MRELVECLSSIDDDRRTGLEKSSLSVRFLGRATGGRSGDRCGRGGVLIPPSNPPSSSTPLEIVVLATMSPSPSSPARLSLASD